MKRTIIALAACFLILSASADVSQSTHGSGSLDLAEIIATADRTNPFDSFESTQRTDASLGRCCKVCTKGKPCGDTCIAQDKTCHVGPGCDADRIAALGGAQRAFEDLRETFARRLLTCPVESEQAARILRVQSGLARPGKGG